MQKAQGTTSASAQKWKKNQQAGEAAADPNAAQAPGTAPEAAPQAAPGPGAAPDGPPPASAIPAEFKMKDEQRVGAWTFRFEAVGVGGYFPSKLPAPFDSPCTELPTSDPQKRLVVYAATNCGDKVFPEETTLALLVGQDPASAPKEGDKVAHFVQAVGIFYGAYFAGRSNFPLAPGVATSSFTSVFGAEQDRFLLGEGPDALVVQRFEGDIFALSQNDEVEGVILGPLPSDPIDERWQLFHSTWLQYSLKGRDLDREIR
jgi:hypothetical protein